MVFFPLSIAPPENPIFVTPNFKKCHSKCHSKLSLQVSLQIKKMG
nr:MAG TPA: hypothetical protein [Caudoviricetes sp.]